MWHYRNDIKDLAMTLLSPDDRFIQSEDMLVAVEFRGSIHYAVAYCRKYDNGCEPEGHEDGIVWSCDSITGKVVGWWEIQEFDLELPVPNGGATP